MAKVVCKNCGHKNPSSAASCSNCGSFLYDNSPQSSPQPDNNFQPVDMQQPAVQDEQPAGETVEAKPYDGPVETVKIAGGNTTQWLGMISSFLVLMVFFGLEFAGVSMPTYTIYVFIALIFLLPAILRTSNRSIRYSSMGFSIPDKPEIAPVDYSNIMNATLGPYTRYEQSVTLFFKNSDPALKMVFNSLMNFRTFIVAMSRRRIPIMRANAAPSTEQAGI